MLIKFFILFAVMTGFAILSLFNGIELNQLFNIQSLVIVFGGMALSIRLGFPREKIRETFQAVRDAMANNNMSADPSELLGELIRIARIYRLHGPFALSRAADRLDNRFLKFGASLVAEGYDKWALLNALEREDKLLANERKTQLQILKTLTRLAPALGMAGTVISLMQVMHDLHSPDSLSGSLGLALSSTLYGILMANLFFIPMTSKVEAMARKESDERAVVAEALLDIHQAEHPMRIAEKLNCYDLYCQIKEETAAKGSQAEKGNDEAAVAAG